VGSAHAVKIVPDGRWLAARLGCLA
jgi:hypothetical protein